MGMAKDTKRVFSSNLEQGIMEFLNYHSNLSVGSLPSHLRIYKNLLLTGDPGYQKISKDRIDSFLIFMNNFGKNTTDKEAKPILSLENIQRLDQVKNVLFKLVLLNGKDVVLRSDYLFKEYVINLFGTPRDQISEILNDFCDFTQWCTIGHSFHFTKDKTMPYTIDAVIFKKYSSFLEKEYDKKTVLVKMDHIRSVFVWAELNNIRIKNHCKYKNCEVLEKNNDESFIDKNSLSLQRNPLITSDALVECTNTTKESRVFQHYKVTSEQEEKINLFINKYHHLSEKNKVYVRTAYKRLLCTGETWKYISKDKRELFLSYMKNNKDEKQIECKESVTNNKIPISDLISKDINKENKTNTLNTYGESNDVFYSSVNKFLCSFTYRNRHLSEQLRNRLFQFITDKFTGNLEKDKSIIKTFSDDEYSFYEEYSHIIDSCLYELEQKAINYSTISNVSKTEEIVCSDKSFSFLKEKLDSLSNKLEELVGEINTVKKALGNL